MTTNNETVENLLFQFEQAINGKINPASRRDCSKIMENHLEEKQRKSMSYHAENNHIEAKHVDHHRDHTEGHREFNRSSRPLKKTK